MQKKRLCQVFLFSALAVFLLLYKNVGADEDTPAQKSRQINAWYDESLGLYLQGKYDKAKERLNRILATLKSDPYTESWRRNNKVHPAKENILKLIEEIEADAALHRQKSKQVRLQERQVRQKELARQKKERARERQELRAKSKQVLLQERQVRQEELAWQKKEQLGKVLEIDADDRQALLALGDISLARKDVEGARKYFSRLLTLAPDSALACYKNGIVELIEKRREKAAALFEKALKADADFVPALSQLLDMLVKEKKMEEALDRCRQQVAISPENSSYYVLLGRLHAANKDFDAARKNFEKGLEIDPNSSDALFSLARLEQSLGSIDTAIAKYQKIRELNPGNPGMAMLIAALLEQKGEYDKAKTIYEEVLDKNPNASVAANNLAFYYAEHEPTKENLARAEELISPLVEKFKDNLEVADTAAWICYRKGDLEKARDLLLGVEEKLGDRPTVSYHMGMIYLGLGEKGRAKEYLQMALKSKEGFPNRKDAERAVKDN
ncbi:MAG: tetratricopeptide repeat protein [Proteobacteria bacterium]|nr:tetratricopeptide repeat protein [Pseudomonadota bacterium]